MVKARAASPALPSRVRVRMYQVGFGDCVLVSFEYAKPLPGGRAERHVLFDLGSTSPPRSGPVPLKDVAALVADHTHGVLDVLVVTHRHKDHLAGFGDQAGSQSITALAPSLVLRPWTENPALPADATSDTSPARFVAHLGAAQEAVERIAGLAQDGPTPGAGSPAAGDQVPNRAALATLDALSAGSHGRYLHMGMPLGLADVVPGVTATVLGPPTIDQSPGVVRQVARDPEYWMLRLASSLDAVAPVPDGSGEGSAGEGSAGGVPIPPGPIRWLVDQLESQKARSVARLVRGLDDALNNTSVILLLEVGGLRMLFPGDAQIEDWRPTLDRLAGDPALTAKLAGLDLYKVGHHGSRNATPRSLHALWTGRPPTAPRLMSLMSTCPDVHGESAATAVPRATLVDALKAVGDLLSTDDLAAGEPFIEVVADATGGPFVQVPH